MENLISSASLINDSTQIQQSTVSYATSSRLTALQMQAEEEAERELLRAIRAKKQEKERKEQKAHREAFNAAAARVSGEILIIVVAEFIEAIHHEIKQA